MQHRVVQLLVALILIIAACIVMYRRWNSLPDDVKADEPETSDVVLPEHVGKLDFLALGDSYTIGESVAANDRWPNQLSARMRQSGVNLSDPMIIARTGWTTGNLLAAMDTNAAKLAGKKFDLVMLLIGVNNQYQRRSADEYRQQFAELLSRSIALANDRETQVIVLSIPDYSVTPFGQSGDPRRTTREIDEFNRINREETAKTKAAYVDITTASRKAATQPNLVADDGLHPSGRQYELWVDQAVEAATRALQK